MYINLLKYYLITFVVVTTLMLLHLPALYFDGTTIEYLRIGFEEERWKSISFMFIRFAIWSIVLTPLFIVFKSSKLFGNILLLLFSFFIGFEKYMIYILGGHPAWNIGFSESTLQAFLSKASMNGFSDGVSQYQGDYHFYLYIVGFSLFVFIFIKLLLRFVIKIDNKIIVFSSFVFFFIVLLAIPAKNLIPYYLRIPYVLEHHLLFKVKMSLFDYKRNKIIISNLDTSKKTPKNIIFIMDESVRGDLISLNNQKEKDVMKATPFLYSIKDQIINFGDLYAICNCSYESNNLLITGAMIDKKTLKNKVDLDFAPTIFQYMKNAGYETYLLDSPKDGNYDGLKPYDRKYIDHYVSFMKEPDLKKDLKSLEYLKKELKKPNKKFFYLIKQGIHFPFENNFNHKNPLFKDWDKKTEKGYYHLYLNAMKKAVDDYWVALIHTVGNTDSVVLWQSDHAVNISPNKNCSVPPITHCDRTMTYYKELYNVPGVLYSPNKDYYKGYHNLTKRYSARAMFPTLLDFAGYTNYEDTYGHTFKNPEKDIYLFSLDDTLHQNYIELNNTKMINKLINKKVEIGDLNKARL